MVRPHKTPSNLLRYVYFTDVLQPRVNYRQRRRRLRLKLVLLDRKDLLDEGRQLRRLTPERKRWTEGPLSMILIEFSSRDGGKSAFRATRRQTSGNLGAK